MQNPRSTAQIAGHPIHPMLIPFPIAFFVSLSFAIWSFGRPAMQAGSQRRYGFLEPGSSWRHWRLLPDSPMFSPIRKYARKACGEWNCAP
jgi:hypothetical protein